MMAAEVQGLVDVLSAGGPYALLVFIAIAYWKKDAYIQSLHKQILDATVQNVQAVGAMKNAIDGLRDTLDALSHRL